MLLKEWSTYYNSNSCEYTNDLKNNNYEHKTPTIVESYRDFIERIRKPYYWQSISNPFPKYCTFKYTAESRGLQGRLAKMNSGCINGTDELFEIIEKVKILGYLSSKSSGIYIDRDILSCFYKRAEPGGMVFIKDNAIYGVNLISESIWFDGNIENSKSINRDWTLFSI